MNLDPVIHLYVVFHGEAVLRIVHNTPCNGTSCSSTWDKDLYEIWARFDKGLIQGPATIISNMMLQTTIAPVIDGIVHGIVVTKGLGPIFPLVMDKKKALSEVKW